MGKFACRCGNVISNVSVPCPADGSLIGEVAFEQAQQEYDYEIAILVESIEGNTLDELLVERFGAVNHGLGLSDLLEDVHSMVFGRRERSLIECESCGRLWVQKSPGLNQYVSFLSEEAKYHGVLKD